MSFHVPNQQRIRSGRLASNASDGNNGAFMLKRRSHLFFCIASDCAEEGAVHLFNGVRWEHVSVTVRTAQRCPTWEEMCFIKSIFWDADDVVFQLHPRQSDYVNNHAFCLHLWRPTHEDGTPVEIPLPPSFLVGDKCEAVQR